MTGQVVEGGHWVRETHDYLSLPLLARPNSVVPVGSNEQQPDYEYADDVTFHVFELDDGATISASVPAAKGAIGMTVELRREGQQLHIRSTGAGGQWRVLLRGVDAIEALEGGNSTSDGPGTLLIPADGIAAMVVRLLPE